MLSRTKNNIIALACFGPISLLLLPWGLLLMPMWVSELANQLAGNPRNIYYTADETIWVIIWPIASLLLGIAGIAGLFRVLSMVNFPNRPHRGIVLTRFLVACGIVAVVIFSAVVGGINPATDTLAAIVYWILPLGGAVYFVYAARKEWSSAGNRSK